MQINQAALNRAATLSKASRDARISYNNNAAPDIESSGRYDSERGQTITSSSSKGLRVFHNSQSTLDGYTGGLA